MKDATPDNVYTDCADSHHQYHDGQNNALEREQSAQFWVQRTRADAEEAAVQARMSAFYLTERYSQRRQDLAQAAEDTAQLVAQNAHRVEEELLLGDFEATITAGRASRHLVMQTHESARLAAIDETELGRCPHCMARLQLLTPLPDATNYRTRFRCAACGTLWQAVHTSERVLLERIAGGEQE